MAKVSDLVAYDDDYHAWVLEQIALLKAARFSDLDVAHLTDELKDLGNITKREIESRLTVLLQHLLKWQFQPDKRSNSWRATILEQRRRINAELADSPSLRRYPASVIDEEYVLARLRAADETGIPLNRFPSSCPYSAAETLDDAFWPGGGGDLEH
jgi:Domain of unknown function DUF29